jgi:flagellar hook-length control protein FliK
MLLGYFLSSTGQDSSMDVKSSSNNASQIANISTDGNTEQFKNALNSTIESRQKYHVKQDDTPFSENELLHAVQEWDKLYSNAENASNTKSIDNLNQFFETGEAKSLAKAAKNQRFHAALNVGDMVPTDGKSLPDNVAGNQKGQDANVSLKAAEIVNSDGTKILPTVNNNSIQQSSNNQAEGQIKDQALTQQTTKSNVESQLQNNMQNKGEVFSQIGEKKNIDPKIIDPKNESLLLNNKPTNTEGVIGKQSLEALKANEISAKIDKVAENSANIQKNLNTPAAKSELISNLLAGTKKVSAEPTKAKAEQSATKSEIISNLLAGTKKVSAEPTKAKAEQSATKSEIMSNLLAGTKKVSAEPIKDKAEKSSNSTTSNSIKSLTGLLDNNNKLTNVIANKEQTEAKVIADNAILKNTYVPVEVSKSKLSEVNAKEIQSTELAKRFNEKSELVQPKQANDILLQSARRDDATASLLQTSAAVSTASTHDSSTSSGIKPLHVSIMDPTSVQNQQNNAQNINKASETTLHVGGSTGKWKQKFAQHVSMLALRGNTNAQIRLDPPELGPMAIRINHTGTETHVQFMVNNAVAKELVDSGTQRLREMLEEQGFENVNVDVNEFSKEQQNLSDNELFENGIDDITEEIQSTSNSNSEKIKSTSLIDLFA